MENIGKNLVNIFQNLTTQTPSPTIFITHYLVSRQKYSQRFPHIICSKIRHYILWHNVKWWQEIVTSTGGKNLPRFVRWLDSYFASGLGVIDTEREETQGNLKQETFKLFLMVINRILRIFLMPYRKWSHSVCQLLDSFYILQRFLQFR